MNRCWLVIVCLCGVVFAQKYNPNEHYSSNLNVSGTYYWGTIFKHSTLFKPDVTQKSHAFELAISRVTKGNHDWEKKLNYPEIGGALFMARFGDNEIFGNAYAVIPYAKFWLKRGKFIDWFFRGGLLRVGAALDDTERMLKLYGQTTTGLAFNAKQLALGLLAEPTRSWKP